MNGENASAFEYAEVQSTNGRLGCIEQDLNKERKIL